MPRSPRLLAPWVGQPGADSAVYHCISRVVNRDRVFGEVEKEHFVHLMRRYERFCGVRILTYSVMGNHFHLEVEVPPRPVGGLSDEELSKRLAELYPPAKLTEFRKKLERCREAGDEEGAERLREKYLYRMWNLSEFMKSLKQCFSRWFNKRHDRRGTLWEERFKSVLVERGFGAAMVGAYIDLNALRAGMVERPEHYRWCGFAEALAGGQAARAAIERLMEGYRREGGAERSGADGANLLEDYRVILYHAGRERVREDPATAALEVVRRGLSNEEADKVIASGGKLTEAEMLGCRVRAMTDGVVIGSRSFVEKFFEARREIFGPKRKSGARRIRGCDTELRVLRDLRKEALGCPRG